MSHGSSGGLTEPMPSLASRAASLLVLSGAAALVYQVAWVRLMGLSMGSTSAAVSTVLAAFFAGMALGSALAERWIRPGVRSMRAFAALEATIAASGLVSLGALLALDHLMAALPAGGQSTAVKFLVAAAVLGIPTTAIGATFPVMTAIWIPEDRQLAPRMSLFYAANTAGAAVGAGLSGFVLVPRLGLDGAVYVAAGLNLTTACLALALARGLREAPQEIRDARGHAAFVQPFTSPSTQTRLGGLVGLLVLFVTGLTSMASEVAWTKYLAIFTGSTLDGFAAILLVFLLGIAIGSALGRRLQAWWQPSVRWLGVGMLVLAAALLLARLGLSYLPELDQQIRLGGWRSFEHPVSLELARYAIVLGVLLAPTLCFGALFPVALSLWCTDVTRLPKRIGRGCAVNTCGAIAGSLLTGFWLIPRFGSDWVLAASAGAVTLTGAVCCLVASKRLGMAAVFSSAALVAALLWTPGLDYPRLLSSAFNQTRVEARMYRAPEFLFLREGKAAVVSLVRRGDGRVLLFSNQLQEASLPDGLRSVPPIAEALLGVLPVLMHPDPQSMFIVGFGGGTTLRAAMSTQIEEVRIAELEPAIVEAVRSFVGDEPPGLADPRSTLLFGDARNILLVEDRRYDIVASQPSHPWVAGAGNLFSREFFEIVRSRLRSGGIHAQWISLFGLETVAFRSILRAFFEVYPHGFALTGRGAADLLLFGSEQPIQLDFQAIPRRIGSLESRSWFEAWRIEDVPSILGHFALSRADALRVAGDVPANTDTRILTEVRRTFDVRGPNANHPASPQRLLTGAFSCDVVALLDPADAADQLESIARFFGGKKRGVARANACFDQLSKLDPIRGRAGRLPESE